MIILFTPATGYPDLEIKIAYGLARVGIEAFDMEKVTIENNGGFYRVQIDANEREFNRLDKTFNMLCRRLLSSAYIPFSTPGVSGRSAESLRVGENEEFFLKNFKTIISKVSNQRSENVCRHRDSSVGNIIGFATSTSYHQKRDGIDTSIQQNIPRRPTNPKYICKTCALLSLLGTWYASFIFNVSNREAIVIPIFRKRISGQRLQEIFTLQHQIRKTWFNQEIPQGLIPLVFLSAIPSSAEILKGFDLFVAILSRQQGYHVDGLYLIPIKNYLDFISYTPYNIATIDVMLRRDAHGSFQELNKAICGHDVASLSKFARLYVQQTSINNFTNLLYQETAKFLLKEVAMISQNIIENSAVASLARTLRYFISKKKYGYADDIRNARRESKDFEETLVKMLREGKLRLEQKEKIHLPTDEEIKEVFKLANEDFESIKLALVILAFSFPQKGEEESRRKKETLEEDNHA